MKETKTTKASIDVLDPLILHHSDHPGIILVSKLLEGHNYGQWIRATHISFSAKNKIRSINGSIEAPTSTDPKFPI